MVLLEHTPITTKNSFATMASMFHLVSSLGGKRDEYGVGDLLVEVSKQSSSISAEDRQAIAAMSQRLGPKKPGSHNSTPRQTPDSSQHDGRNGKQNRTNYGKDLLQKDDLLRGFGSSSSPINSEEPSVSPPSSPNRLDDRVPRSGVLLRGFGPSSSTTRSSGALDEPGGAFVPGFEQARKL